MIFELDEKTEMERNKKDNIAKKETERRWHQWWKENRDFIVKEDVDDDDFGGMTIQQWACLDGLSKSFKEDNT